MIGTQMILPGRIAAIALCRTGEASEAGAVNVIAFRASDAAGSMACTRIHVDRGWPDGL